MKISNKPTVELCFVLSQLLLKYTIQPLIQSQMESRASPGCVQGFTLHVHCFPSSFIFPPQGWGAGQMPLSGKHFILFFYTFSITYFRKTSKRIYYSELAFLLCVIDRQSGQIIDNLKARPNGNHYILNMTF